MLDLPSMRLSNTGWARAAVEGNNPDKKATTEMSTDFENSQAEGDQVREGPADEPVGAEYYPQPAGFWIRAVAMVLDGFVFLPVVALLFYNAVRWKSMAVFFLVVWLPGVLYKPLMEAYWGATLGKMACRLIVVDETGHLLSIAAAYTRFLPFFLLRVLGLVGMLAIFLMPEFRQARSPEQVAELQIPRIIEFLQLPLAAFVFCDCLAVAVTDGKRAIHDFMAGSYCVMSSSWTESHDDSHGGQVQ